MHTEGDECVHTEVMNVCILKVVSVYMCVNVWLRINW